MQILQPMNPNKKFFPALAAALTAMVILVGCGPKPSGDLAELAAKRDSLKTAKDEISTKISELEAQIAKLDTNMKENYPAVTFSSYEPQRFEHFFQVQGTIETDQNAQIFPEAQGKITSIPVKEGQQVSAGQVLMVIDSKVLRNSIQEVENQLALATTVFDKQKNLWDQKIGSEIQFLEAKTNKEGLQRKLETLRAQLDMYNVRAPFSGIVDEILPKEGEMASPAMPAFRLINLDKVYIKADVSESYLGKLQKGDSVRVVFPSLNRTIWTSISRMGNFINPNNRTFKIRLNMDNGSGMLKPNLLAEIHIMDFAADSALAIPTSLIQEDPAGNQYIMLVDEREGVQYAQKQLVETGLSYGGFTHISNGLETGTKVVVEGARNVKDGQRVELVM